MRRVGQLIAHGLLRSRVGVALLLAAVVLGVVGVAKIFSDSAGAQPGLDGAPDQPILTVSATVANDGLASPEPTPSPKVSPGTAVPASVAEAFGQAWVNHQDVTAEDWYAGLLPHCTETLAKKLAGVDPAGVPADSLTGDPVLIPYADQIVDATIRVDSGMLRLRLMAIDGRWLVDGIDWERG
ncbi:hypothetical protein GCM10022251_04910 [Phytohabitans flavus]|uniref:Uncharacterized protein n=1 Tax=Phytohabitans flavus TaxID=1076124 RepID=A0A6F8Y2Z0_9ACTN|nr:hypothetical protein [Phytohabitans flavus]BCB80348.1 hypothetical protein Pflav_067580 [Phytohabitans flavus]